MTCFTNHISIKTNHTLSFIWFLIPVLHVEFVDEKEKKDKKSLRSRDLNPWCFKIPSHNFNDWRWWDKIQARKLNFLNFNPKHIKGESWLSKFLSIPTAPLVFQYTAPAFFFQCSLKKIFWPWFCAISIFSYSNGAKLHLRTFVFWPQEQR